MRTDLPGALRAALDTAEKFDRGDVDIETLQAVIRAAGDTVTEHELRDLRRFLHSAEGQLEMARFALGIEKQHAEALRIARAVRDRIADVFGVP